MYDKQRKGAAKGQGASQRLDAVGSASAELRHMNYDEGRAHLTPGVQLSPSAESGGGDKEKLLRLVTAYVDATFGGDMELAFNHYAKEGSVDKDGVTQMLVDAGVKKAFGFVKWMVIPGMVMDHFDTDGDGKITVAEFNKGLEV